MPTNSELQRLASAVANTYPASSSSHRKYAEMAARAAAGNPPQDLIDDWQYLSTQNPIRLQQLLANSPAIYAGAGTAGGGPAGKPAPIVPVTGGATLQPGGGGVTQLPLPTQGTGVMYSTTVGGNSPPVLQGTSGNGVPYVELPGGGTPIGGGWAGTPGIGGGDGGGGFGGFGGWDLPDWIDDLLGFAGGALGDAVGLPNWAQDLANYFSGESDAGAGIFTGSNPFTSGSTPTTTNQGTGAMDPTVLIALLDLLAGNLNELPENMRDDVANLLEALGLSGGSGGVPSTNGVGSNGLAAGGGFGQALMMQMLMKKMGRGSGRAIMEAVIHGTLDGGVIQQPTAVQTPRGVEYHSPYGFRTVWMHDQPYAVFKPLAEKMGLLPRRTRPKVTAADAKAITKADRITKRIKGLAQKTGRLKVTNK